MLTHNLGYPRIGSDRALKKASEQYWTDTITTHTLQQTASDMCRDNWHVQQGVGLNLIPSNDFSFYDQATSLISSPS